MALPEQLAAARADASFYNYYRLARDLPLDGSAVDASLRATIRVAFVGNVTLEPLARYTAVACYVAGVNPTIHVAPFAQHAQELLQPDSALFAWSPELTILLLDRTELLADSSSGSSSGGVALVESLMDSFERHCSGILLVHNLPVPSRTAHTNLELRHRDGPKRITTRFNEELAELCTRRSRCYVVDLEGLLGEYGKTAGLDLRMSFLGRLPFALEFIPVISREYVGYVKGLLGQSRKCVVVDADNTLWGGVVGEDGLNGIAIGANPPGNAFLAFQQTLLALSQRGVLLALNSRNNPDDVYEVLDRHPDQLLRREHFAAIRANWESKASNLVSLAAELNIGLDAMIFVDDDPVNREAVRHQLPQVLVLDLPSDPASYCSALLGLNDLHAVSVTAEDGQRGRFYTEERRRAEARVTFSSPDDYLRHLGLRATFSLLDSFTFSRAAQLCARTNQFNATSRRHSEGEIRRMAQSKEWILLTVALQDRYGDSGHVGLCFMRIAGETAVVDTLLLSCRALGRGVEDALLATALTLARRHGARTALAEIRTTLKNRLIADFYSTRGFRCVARDADGSAWDADLTILDLHIPAFLTVDGPEVDLATPTVG